MTRLWREDIECILQRDPAARSRLEVLLCYPGLHAVWLHRISHWLWRHRWCLMARMLAHLGRGLTGIEIHPAARLGRRVFIDHGMGVVIGETAQVGDDCTLYQGVTLGGTAIQPGSKRHPTLESGVVVGAGAKVLGAFIVGQGARIGSNAVVVKPVPAGATAVGNPAHVRLAPEVTNDRLASPAAVTGQQSRVGLQTVQAADDQTSWLNPEQPHIVAEGTSQSTTVAPITASVKQFTPYGLMTQGEDPVTQALHQLTQHLRLQAQRLSQLEDSLREAGVAVPPSRSNGGDETTLRHIDELLKN